LFSVGECFDPFTDIKTQTIDRNFTTFEEISLSVDTLLEVLVWFRLNDVNCVSSADTFYF